MFVIFTIKVMRMTNVKTKNLNHVMYMTSRQKTAVISHELTGFISA